MLTLGQTVRVSNFFLIYIVLGVLFQRSKFVFVKNKFKKTFPLILQMAQAFVQFSSKPENIFLVRSSGRMRLV